MDIFLSTDLLRALQPLKVTVTMLPRSTYRLTAECLIGWCGSKWTQVASVRNTSGQFSRKTNNLGERQQIYKTANPYCGRMIVEQAELRNKLNLEINSD